MEQARILLHLPIKRKTNMKFNILNLILIVSVAGAVVLNYGGGNHGHGILKLGEGDNLGASITAAFPAALNAFVELGIVEDEDLNAIEETIGITNSTVVTSHDFLIKNASSSLYLLDNVDGGFVVGDDTNYVIETGSTARTSIGLGTGDSPTFTGLTLTNDLTVANGGTGASTFTDGGILLGSGTGAITALGVASNGQIPIGDNTTDPVLATITGGTAITITNGAGTITAAVTADAITATQIDETVAYTWTGDHNFSGGGIEVENGITPPACIEGQLFFDTDATSGQRLLGCESTTFVVQGDGGANWTDNGSVLVPAGSEGIIVSASSTFSSGLSVVGNTTTTDITSAGNLTISAASGSNVFIGDGSTLITIDGNNNNVAIGSTSAFAWTFMSIIGTKTATSSKAYALNFDVSLTADANNDVLSLIALVDGHTIAKGSNTGLTYSVINIDGQAANSSGAGTIDNASAIYIQRAPNIGTDNYSLWVDAGVTRLDGTLYIEEQADADGDIVALGQLWVDNLTPNILMFTDDAGTDFIIAHDATTALSSLVTVSALNSGSISTGFGNIDNGTSNITTGGNLTVDASTGEVNFGSATSTEITNAAEPYLNADGEVATDSSSDQFLYRSTQVNVISRHKQICATVENLAAADDNFQFWSAFEAVTVTDVWCRVEGAPTATSTFALEDSAGNAMTHNAPWCQSGSTNATTTSVTAGGALVTGEGLRFDVTNAVSPETDTYTLCMAYLTDRQ